MTIQPISNLYQSPYVASPTKEELGQSLLRAVETVKIEEISNILESSRAQEITLEDFTKAFQTMASKDFNLRDLPYGTSISLSLYMEAFSLFINDPRFNNIGKEDIVEALLGAAKNGRIECVDAILESNRAKEELTIEDLHKTITILNTDKYQVIDTEDYLDTIEKIIHFVYNEADKISLIDADELEKRLKSFFINEIGDVAGDSACEPIMERISEWYDEMPSSLDELIEFMRELASRSVI